MTDEGKLPWGQKRKIDGGDAQTKGEPRKRMHHISHAHGGLPQSADSHQYVNAELPAAVVRDYEIQRLNTLLKQSHDRCVSLAKLVNLPATSIEQLPTLISSITNYLESNIVRYSSTDGVQEAEQAVVDPTYQDGPVIVPVQETRGPTQAIDELVLEGGPAIPLAKEAQEDLQDVKDTAHQHAPAAPSAEGSGAGSGADDEYVESGKASDSSDDNSDDSAASSQEEDHSDKRDPCRSSIGVRGRPPIKAAAKFHPPRRTGRAAHVVTPSRRPVYQGKQIMLSP